MPPDKKSPLMLLSQPIDTSTDQGVSGGVPWADAGATAAMAIAETAIQTTFHFIFSSVQVVWLAPLALAQCAPLQSDVWPDEASSIAVRMSDVSWAERAA
jgi:hypothetical protein